MPIKGSVSNDIGDILFDTGLNYRTVRIELSCPLAVSLLVELELRGNNEYVGNDERNTLLPDFRASLHCVT